jgi:hypothetical protein
MSSGQSAVPYIPASGDFSASSRFRQSIQYSYAAREGWSGTSGIGAKGIDNMFWTSPRYCIP